MTGTLKHWLNGEPVLPDIGLGELKYWLNGQPFIIFKIEVPATSPDFTDKNNYNGYLAFIQQYIRHKINATTPWKNPDGTLL